MILDAWFRTGTVIGVLSLLICLVAAAVRRYPADSAILSAAAVELFLIVYGVAGAIRQFSGDTLNGPGWEFWGYVITALLIPPLAVAWAITDKTRWANVVLAVAGPTVVVMLHRMQVIWYGQW